MFFEEEGMHEMEFNPKKEIVPKKSSMKKLKRDLAKM